MIDNKDIEKEMKKKKYNAIVQPYYKELGDKLNQLKVKAGLSQKELAVHLMVEENQISKYIKGKAKMKAHEVYILARLFGESLDDIMIPEKEGKSVRSKEMELNQEIFYKIIGMNEKQKKALLAFLTEMMPGRIPNNKIKANVISE